MLYIVSGMMRSGTSAMVRAIDAGGIPASWSPERTQRIRQKYPSPGDFEYYEIDPNEAVAEDVLKKYNDRVIKLLVEKMYYLDAEEFRVVFMRRSMDSIAKSMEANFKCPLVETRAKNIYGAHIRKIIKITKDRRSCVSFDEVWLEDLVTNPARELAKLNWPINPAAAAAVIKAEDVRNGY